MRSDEMHILRDEIAQALVRTKPMRRLGRIGFLGAIDYVKRGSGRSPHRRRHNRLEHSIGVAKLAEQYCDLVGMAQHDRNLVVAAALLHDIGHGPLSHTLEPVFEEAFGINHHRASREIIRGETALGNEILTVLLQYAIDPDQVIALIDGEQVNEYSFLFASQLNLDTLEGITRCRAFVGPRPAFGSAHSIVSKMAEHSSLPQNDFDEFWKLKHNVYNLFINARLGRAFDTLAQAYMRANLDSFSKEDFLKTEVELKRSHADLFKMFRKLANKEKGARDELPSAWLESSVEIRDRRFFVRYECLLEGNNSINDRYRQSKNVRRTTLDDLLS
mgnify:CR=1 FL=1|tara:strand:- start:4562 stop:5554 length:993 start_codon:yes stop_codon:yes gene_type:complete